MYIEPKPLSRYPWYLQPLFWWQRRRHGELLEPARLWARVPRMFTAVTLLGSAVERRSGRIEEELRGWIAVRVAQLNNCAFEADRGSAALQRGGVAEAKLAALPQWRSSDGFTNRERAVLDYAEAVTRSDLPLTADVVGTIKRLFDDDARVELTAVIAFYNLTSKFNHALAVSPHDFGVSAHRVDAPTDVSRRRGARAEQGGEE